MDPIIYSYDWRPINVSSRVQEISADNSRLNFNHTIVEMPNTMPESTYAYSDKFVDQLNSRTIENELEILNIDALMAFVGPNNVVEMTITTMASNIIVSLGWIILGTLYLGAKLMAGADSQISLFADILGPQAIGGNVMRCVVGFLFTLVGILGKTMLTIGMHDTMHQFIDSDMDEMWNMVSNDKFLKDSLIRGILSTMFLVLGWSMIGLVAKSAIFSSTNPLEIFESSIFGGDRRKRRKRQVKDRNVIGVSNSFNLHHIERTFPSLTKNYPGLNDYIISNAVLRTLKRTS